MGRFPLNVLLGTGLGAAGGAVIAPKGERLSSTLQGAAWGTVAGGVGPAIGKGIVSKMGKGKFGSSFVKRIKETPYKESAIGAGIVTGTTAVVNKVTGAYNPEDRSKNRIIRAVAPGADDLAMLGWGIMKGIRG